MLNFYANYLRQKLCVRILKLCLLILFNSLCQRTLAHKLQEAKVINESQQIKITGQVKDEKGEVLPGVSVKLKGDNKVTNTDNEGRY